MIKSLAHVCLKTRDLTRTADFYCGVLGLEKRFDFVKAGHVIGFYLKAANHTFIEVFLDETAAPNQSSPSLHHFCFETDSLRSLHQKLTEYGYAPGEISLGADRALQFWVRDPNDVAMEFQEYSDRNSQWTGEPVRLE